jgi:hypothetical protein
MWFSAGDAQRLYPNSSGMRHQRLFMLAVRDEGEAVRLSHEAVAFRLKASALILDAV